jgi:hypothetical protein
MAIDSVRTSGAEDIQRTSSAVSIRISAMKNMAVMAID